MFLLLCQASALHNRVIGNLYARPIEELALEREVSSNERPKGTLTGSTDLRRSFRRNTAGQPTVNYSYDNAKRLTQTTQGSATVTIADDDAGRRTSLTLS